MADILIRGMEMPKTCGDCPLSAFRMDCKLTGRDISRDWMKRKIPDWCPLVPLPEGHGRIVDAAEILEKANNSPWFDGDVSELGLLLGSEVPTIVPSEGD